MELESEIVNSALQIQICCLVNIDSIEMKLVKLDDGIEALILYARPHQ